jgi:hypothetical protein
LAATITGVPQADPPLPGLADRLKPYLGWLDNPHVLTIKYEAFFVDRQSILRAILEHAIKRGFPLSQDLEEAILVLESHIQPQRSPTFRKGSAGGWREVFTPQQKQLFKEHCPGIVTLLGYDKDENW